MTLTEGAEVRKPVQVSVAYALIMILVSLEYLLLHIPFTNSSIIPATMENALRNNLWHLAIALMVGSWCLVLGFLILKRHNIAKQVFAVSVPILLILQFYLMQQQTVDTTSISELKNGTNIPSPVSDTAKRVYEMHTKALRGHTLVNSVVVYSTLALLYLVTTILLYAPGSTAWFRKEKQHGI